MRAIQLFECEICNEQYDNEEGARACEALGFPEPMPFLPLDEVIPAFGEDGVNSGQIIAVRVQGSTFYRKHRWEVCTTPYVYVSHNLEGSWIPAAAFDPRHGWDPFRYVCTPEDAAAWEQAMQRYGFSNDEVPADILAKIADAKK